MAASRPVTPPPEAGPPGRGPEHEEQVRQVGEWLISPGNYSVGRLGVLVTRPIGLEPSSARGAMMTGAASAAVRLLLPLLAGLAVGDLAESPVGRWALIAGLLGLLDVVTARRVRKSDQFHADLLALVDTLERESDVQALGLLVRRRWRLLLNMVFAAVTACLALVSFALVAPSAFAALPTGTVVLIGILAYELGEGAYLYIGFMPAFLAQLARSEHRLFWLNPLESEPVRRTLHGAEVNLGFVGLAVTQYVVLSVYLISLDSALLLPVAGTFTVIGYVAVGVCLVGIRRAVRTIATRVRDRHLSVLGDRIDGFGNRLGSITPVENDELRHLIETYRSVREMPTSLSSSESLGHAGKALIVPTVGLLLAVMSEVYAERLLNQFLP